MNWNGANFVAVLGTALTLAVAGCSGEIYRKSTLGDLQTLSVDARQRLSFVGYYQDQYGHPQRALCTEPSPDAIVARAAALAAGARSPLIAPGGTPSSEALSAAIAASSSESAASIGLRTQTIQLMRDAYFRACEGLLNGVVDEEDYGVILANADAVTIALAAIEALGGTAQAPAVAIAAGGAGGTVAPGSDANAQAIAGNTNQPLLDIGTVAHDTGTINEHQANAIAAIALEVIRHSHVREGIIYSHRGRK
jgi:hypothetical protein